jgi:hypothetical protein
MMKFLIGLMLLVSVNVFAEECAKDNDCKSANGDNVKSTCSSSSHQCEYSCISSSFVLQKKGDKFSCEDCKVVSGAQGGKSGTPTVSPATGTATGTK